ncbi:MAG: hypothetical protein KDE35_04305 [Geminicoccaceae bacterium]|nr:hypothetical protein [Geminicoccaceae bacterium]
MTQSLPDHAFKSRERAPALGVMLLLGLLQAGCSDDGLGLPPRPAAPDPIAGADLEAEPQLAGVPALPRLTYDLAQSRRIEGELAADRDNARYRGQALQHDVGLRAAPPDRPRPAPAPRAEPVEPVEPADDLATVQVRETLRQDADDGSLDDFLDALERGQAAAVASPRPDPRPDSEQIARADDEAAPAPGPADGIEPPVAPVSERPSGEVAAIENTAPPLEVEAPDDGTLAVIFAPNSAVFPDPWRGDLASMAAWLRQERLGATVRAQGSPAVLATDRARAIAVQLVQAGVPADWIEVETGGTGDLAVIYADTSSR